MNGKVLECVPNFSEGRNEKVIRQIAAEITKVPEVKLLHIDSGKAANRTVMTFAGAPEQVTEAAFRAIKKAAELIDMQRHKGVHPRIGATDVCPLVPVKGMTQEEVVRLSRQLGKRVAEELHIPVYLYEHSAAIPQRKNLASIRAGEYEGLEAKLKDPLWKPDFGEALFNARSGATVIGARNYLVAYNVNLDTTSIKLANAIAADVRESGRVKKARGKIVYDADGMVLREPGLLKYVKSIGWFIEEYGIAQVSMNLTNIKETPVHLAFETCCRSAAARGVKVTGSELIGMIPLKCLLDAGTFYLNKKEENEKRSEEELVQIAVQSLGLNDLYPFDPAKKVIEYALKK